VLTASVLPALSRRHLFLFPARFHSGRRSGWYSQRKVFSQTSRRIRPGTRWAGTIDKTGNVAAVQRQLGHKNAAYSLQYARITDAELQEVVDER
jgi:hypothetical protein